MKEVKLKNESTFTLRNATITDAKSMLDYIDKISAESDFLTFGRGEFNMTLKEEEAFIDGTLKRNNALFIIAEVEGKIVGNLNFSGGVRPRTAHTGEFGVSVLKEYWGQGLGTELVSYLIEWSKSIGIIRKINLKVRSDNSSAIHVYKKLGFTQEGIITREFSLNNQFYDCIAMGLNID